MSFHRTAIGLARLPGIAWSFSRKGFESRSKNWAPEEGSLQGKEMAVTGANSGLGFATAQAWAKRNANVWMLCRNEDRGLEALEKLKGLGTGEIHLELVDLSNLDSINALVERAKWGHLDALVHNAGALHDSHQQSPQGIELTFACHVVGPQRLTKALLPVLRNAEVPRVVYVSSGGMYAEPLDLEDSLAPPEPFDGIRAYALAKRAQVVLCEEWAKRHPDIGFFSMHPGWVDTPGVHSALPRFYRLTKSWLRNWQQGADTTIWLTSTADLSAIPSGSLVFDRETVSPNLLPGTKTNEGSREQLWSKVEELANAPQAAKIITH